MLCRGGLATVGGRWQGTGGIMIVRYGDHAANERTYLAWVRTGIAVIVFGFVIEKFNLFVLMIAGNAAVEAHRMQLERLSGPFGRYDGLAFIFAGLALIVAQTARYIRTARLIDDPDQHAAGGVRAELFFSAVLVLLVAGFSVFLVLE
jgi:putative membrane protein